MSLLVIGPGSGTLKYKPLWDILKQNFKLNIVHGIIHSINYDVYPTNWETSDPYIEINDSHNLASLAYHVLIKYLDMIEKDEKIIAIVCGSRGGQVTLPALWRLFDQLDLKCPPCIVMNSGVVNTVVKWPENKPIILLSFGKDYFNTKDPNIVLHYAKQQKSFGYVIHIPNDSHEPVLFLPKIIVDIINNIPESKVDFFTKMNILKPIIISEVNGNIYSF